MMGHERRHHLSWEPKTPTMTEVAAVLAAEADGSTPEQSDHRRTLSPVSGPSGVRPAGNATLKTHMASRS